MRAAEAVNVSPVSTPKTDVPGSGTGSGFMSGPTVGRLAVSDMTKSTALRAVWKLFTPYSALRAMRSSMTLVLTAAMLMSVTPINIINTMTRTTPF